MLITRIVTNVVGYSLVISVTRIKSQQEKLNEAVMMLNKTLQVSRNSCVITYRMVGKSDACQSSNGIKDINIHNMNIELVAQMFKNYRSNVLFHLEGSCVPHESRRVGRFVER